MFHVSVGEDGSLASRDPFQILTRLARGEAWHDVLGPWLRDWSEAHGGREVQVRSLDLDAELETIARVELAYGDPPPPRRPWHASDLDPASWAALIQGEPALGQWPIRVEGRPWGALRAETSDDEPAFPALAAAIGAALERKALRDRLEEERLRFRLAVDTNRIAMWSWDLESGELSGEAVFSEILGHFPLTALPSLNAWASRLHPHDRASFAQAVLAHLDGQAGEVRITLRMLDREGKTRWVELRGVGLRPAGSRIRRLVGTARDLTAEVDAERRAERATLDLREAYDSTLAGWSRALDLRDHETEDHSERVAHLTVRLAERMGVPEDARIHIYRGALLHDIGKIGVPDAILLKDGPLEDHEWEVMRRHPQIAVDLLEPIEYLRPALDIPFCHHERWDGHGYPRGLRGEEIPFAARIFAVVDVWDALTHTRPYRGPMPVSEVQEYLRREAGRSFDPAVVDAFFSLMSAMSFQREAG